MSQPISVSVSVVVHKPDLDLLGRSLQALHASIVHARERMAVDVEVVVIDNSLDAAVLPGIQSTLEGSLPSVRSSLLVSPVNAGYGAGNNLAIRPARSKYHVVANPDVFPSPDALLLACQYMEAHPQVTLLTPQVRGEDDELHYLCKQHPSLFIMFLRSFAPTPVRERFRGQLERFEMRDRDYAQVIDGVGYPTGCFMFFRTDALQAIGGFDERFFMYLEDADIGRRILGLGPVRYVPSVKIVHRWARGSHRNPRLRWITVQSAFIYWRKWGGVFAPTGGERR